MMALDGKTIIKEEITEKDAYEATSCLITNRRNKGILNSSGGCNTSTSSSSSVCGSGSGSSCVNKDSQNPSNAVNNNSSGSSIICSNNTRSCRTPDSPESARAIAPRSPMSPQLHQHHNTTLALPSRPNRNASASPIVNGAITTSTPPPSVQLPPSQSQSTQATAVAVTTAAVVAAHVEQARLLSKIRKFLGSLVQLAQEVHPEVSDRVRGLVISLATGNITIDDFRLALQDAINLPLRPYVIPLLKNHISLLQREIVALARATSQTTLQYVKTNETCIMEFSPQGPPAEYNDIFVHIESPSSANGNIVFKRRSSDTLMDVHGHNGAQDWGEYMVTYPPPKRIHAHNSQLNVAGPPDNRLSFTSNQSTIFDYSTSGPTATQSESSFNNLVEKSNHRDERDIRNSIQNEVVNHRPLARNMISNSGSSGSSSQINGPGMSGEEEWKNIHTMLNCISAMVDKTKRAITILQQRGVEPQQSTYGEVTPASLIELRRQTEEKVSEFKRNAEEAVNQVKRQAVIEIQRAVVAAETRAAEVMAQERLRMEKFFVEISRQSGVERDLDNKSPSIAATQNACWNCGRKATETCSGCNLARYCGAFCQHKDWEHHHQICGTTRTTDHSAKHGSQVIPLTSNMRGSIARSPPTTLQAAGHNQQPSQTTTSQQQQQQQQTSGSGVSAVVVPPLPQPPQATSLITNGFFNFLSG